MMLKSPSATTFSRKQGFASSAASAMSAWKGFDPVRFALRTIGLEPLPKPSLSARLWFFMIVSRPAMPGRTYLRPPPYPARK